MYKIVMLDGYTEGKPSWVMASRRRFYSKEEAEKERDAMQDRQSKTEYRVRKIATRR